MESVHTVVMISHSVDIVKNAVAHLILGQIPPIISDQPLFALAKQIQWKWPDDYVTFRSVSKQIQWKWPDDYGEDHIVVMFGGLHMKMVALKTLGDWMK